MTTNFINEVGNRYGKLTVIKRARNDKRSQAMWLCQCDCGNLTTVRGTDLRRGNTRSCGCLQKEVASKSGEAHPNWRGGMSSREHRLHHKYGITLIEYDHLLEAQDGICAICGKTPEENGQRLSVDHNHETGEVRGLLCGDCNRGLGMFHDNPQLTVNATKYLRKQREGLRPNERPLL